MTYLASRTAVIVLIMLLPLCGHDALMAANPHEQDVSRHLSQGDAVLDTQCLAPDDIRVAPTDASGPDVCPVVISMEAVILFQREVVAIARRPAPDYPPDVRRAFLQVFLN